MLTHLVAALTSKQPLRVALRRAWHLYRGHHDIDNSVLIERHRYRCHPQNTWIQAYTVNLMHCRSCGLHWLDEGFEIKEHS